MKKLGLCVDVRHLTESPQYARVLSLTSACLLALFLVVPAWAAETYIKSDSPVFLEATPDRALVYFLETRPGTGTIEVYVDETPIGFLPAKSYTAVRVEPGIRFVWGLNRSQWFEFKQGRTYLLRRLQLGSRWYLDSPDTIRPLVLQEKLTHVTMSAVGLERLQAKRNKVYEAKRKGAAHSKVEIVLPKTFPYVGYVEKAKMRFDPIKAIDDNELTISAKRIEYRSRKKRVVIPVTEIQRVSLAGSPPPNFPTPWLLVSYGQAEAPKTAFFVGPRYNVIFASIMAAMEGAKGADAETETVASAESASLAQAESLHDAAEKGNIDEVKRLIADGANVNAKDEHTVTALHWAADHGHTAVVELLIAEGADVDAKSFDGVTPLWKAAQQGHLAVVQLLIDNGADLHSKDQFLDLTPLGAATFPGHLAIVQLLVAKGADVNVKNKNAITPLHLAAYQGHMAVAELLIAEGADVNAKEQDGNTPRGLAIDNGHKELARLLKRHGGKK